MLQAESNIFFWSSSAFVQARSVLPTFVFAVLRCTSAKS